MPDCALCKKNKSELSQSHIIPKLVYKRIRSHPQSRFRNLSDIRKPLQDGEKHEMLCCDCEVKFSILESKFASEFLDIYLIKESIPKTNPNFGWLSNYCLSVSWRILFDDLFRVNSYINYWYRSPFEQFESVLHNHLNKEAIDEQKPSEIENYIFKLNEIVKTREHSVLLEKMIFGYSYFDAINNIFVVFTYYAGLIFATRYFPKNYIVMGNTKFFLINLFKTKKKMMKNSLQREINIISPYIALQYKKEMTPELAEKIKLFYRGK